MPSITDPTDGLISFQQALRAGEIKLTRGEINRDVFVFLDHPNGEIRVTYVTLDKKTVTAMAIIVMAEAYQGERCFGIGWAVPVKYRRQGRAKNVVNAAIAEFTHGLARSGVPSFYLEAIVGAENAPSQRVAEQTISKTAKPTKDGVSGLAALAYVRRVQPGDA